MYPAGPEFIDPDWLNSRCSLGGQVSGVRSTTIGEGVGMLGLLGRLSLDYESGTGPSSVIAKLASPHEPVLDLVQSYGFYEREVNFYRHANGAIANIPRSYYADVDPSGRAFALVLEDLSHCRVPDQVAGCSAADATAVMKSVATMHARYWNIDSEPSFDWLPKGNEGTYRQGEAQHGMIYEPFLAAFGDRLSETGRRVADLLRTKTLLMSDAAIARGPLTLVHMDMRLDNVLFDDAAADDSPSVFFIDWHSARRVSARRTSPTSSHGPWTTTPVGRTLRT